MEGSQLDKILKKDPVLMHVYDGIYCSDNLRYPLIKNKLWVINTAKSTDDKGIHWLLIHTLKPDYVEFLCSSKSNYKDFPHITKCIETYSKNIYTFSHRTQETWSTSCATHVLFYSFCVSRFIFGREILKRYFMPYIRKKCLFKAEIFVAECTQQLYGLKDGLTQGLILDLDFLGEQIIDEQKKRKKRNQRKK